MEWKQKGKKTQNVENKCCTMLPSQQSIPNQSQSRGLSHFPSSLSTEHDTIWCGIPLGSFGVTCVACVPSQLFVPTRLLTGGGERQKSPQLKADCLATSKHQCVTKVTLILNSSHNMIPATRNKINTMPAKPRTALYEGNCIAPPDSLSALLLTRCCDHAITSCRALIYLLF